MLLNESLLISYSTPNYPFTTDFIKSLNDLGVYESNINLHIDSTIIEPQIVEAHSVFWINIKIKRLKNLIDKLKDNIHNKDYKYFISSDCDIWFLKENIEEWNNLQKYIDQSSKDIFFMTEGRCIDGQGGHNINSGFYIIKNNQNLQNIINFFVGVFSTLLMSEPRDIRFGDQTIINREKYSINFGYIPDEYVIWGSFIFDRFKALIHHPVCCIDAQQKRYSIDKIKRQMRKITYNIVIAKYKEDLGWTDHMDKSKIIIYDKSDNPIESAIQRPNIGRDPETFIYHIVQNYENLPDYLCFLQGNPFEHMNGVDIHNIQGKINEVIYNDNITVDAFYNALCPEPMDMFEHSMKLRSYFSFLFKHPCDNHVHFVPGCQYIVSKKNILDRPKKFFEYIHSMVYNTKITTFDQAHSQENAFDKHTMSAWNLERLLWFIFNSETYNLSDEMKQLTL